MPPIADPTQERIESLALSCLEAFEREGEVAVERACGGNADDEAAVLHLLQSLSRFGLLGESPEQQDGPQPGDQLGDFRLLRRLGGGGMGVVFLAEQASLHRRVALKLLRPGLLDRARSRSRFQREIETISGLDHPGICTVYEAGEVDGRPYLAMRHIEGETLAARLKRLGEEAARNKSGSTSSGGIAETLLLVEKVGRALHHAHERGVVHRDVKPGNVIVTPEGEPVLLDFGLAVAADAESGITISGDVLGTPQYMAPEQVRGDRGAIDRRTDVYALGALLYECLALQPPFVGRTREDLYRQILGEPPPDLRRSARGVGGELWTVLQKALEKEPRRRFASALDFADELRRISRHEPIVTRRPGVVVRSVRWCQRNRVAAAVMGTALLGLAASLWTLALYAGELRRSQAQACALAADRVMPGEPILALQLAYEAAQLDPIPSNLGLLHQAMGQVHELAKTEVGSLPFRVRYSPDGTTILVGSVDGTRLLSADGEPIAHFQTPGKPGPADFTAEGNLVFADAEFVVHLVDPDGKERAAWPHGEQVSMIRCSPTTGRILLVETTGRAFVCDPDGERMAECVDEEIGRAHRPEHRPMAAVWDPEGRFVVTADGWTEERTDVFPPFSACVRVWRPDGALIDRLPGAQREIFRLACAGDRIAAACTNGTGLLWSTSGDLVYSGRIDGNFTCGVAIDDRAERAVFTTLGGTVRLVGRDGTAQPDMRLGAAVFGPTFLPWSRRLAMGTWHGNLVITRAPDPLGIPQYLPGHLNGVWDVAASSRSERIVSVSLDGTARIWQPKPIGVRQLEELWSDVRRVAATSDGERVITAATTGELVVRDAAGRVLDRLAGLGPGDPVMALHIAPDDRTLLVAHSKGRILRWDVRALSPPREAEFPSAGVMDIRQSAPGELVVAAGNAVYRWSPETANAPELLHTTSTSTSTCVFSLALCGKDMLAIGCEDGEIVLLESDGGHRSLREHDKPIHWLACSPDGGFLLSASADRTACLWDLAAADREPVRLEGHTRKVTWAAFLPYGRRVVTGSHDYMLRVFDRRTGRMDLILPKHFGTVWSGFVTADGSQVASSSEDGTVRWWWVRAKDIVREAEKLLERPNIGELSPEKRERALETSLR